MLIHKRNFLRSFWPTKVAVLQGETLLLGQGSAQKKVHTGSGVRRKSKRPTQKPGMTDLICFCDLRPSYRATMLVSSFIWLDNFQSSWFATNESLAKSPFQMMNLTGMAVHAYSGPEVDMRVKYKDDGSMLPASPLTLDHLLSFAPEIQTDIIVNEIHGKSLLDTSLTKRFHVNTIPVKLNIRAKHAEEHKLLS